MIFILAISQLFYQIPLFFIYFYESVIAEVVGIFISTIGYVSASLWTNIMTCIVAYLVYYLKSYNIIKYIYYILAVTSIISIIFAIVITIAAASGQDGTFFQNMSYLLLAFRLSSLGFNVTMYCFMIFHVYFNRSYRNIGESGEESLRTIVNRIGYYPIIQSIARIGSTWHELSYGAIGNLNPTNPIEIASLFLLSICISIAGIGYFIIFLKTQPNAYEYLLKNNCLKNIINYVFLKAKVSPMQNNAYRDVPHNSHEANDGFVNGFENQIQKNSLFFRSSLNNPTNYENQFKNESQFILQFQLQSQSILQLQSMSLQSQKSQLSEVNQKEGRMINEMNENMNKSMKELKLIM